MKRTPAGVLPRWRPGGPAQGFAIAALTLHQRNEPSAQPADSLQEIVTDRSERTPVDPNTAPSPPGPGGDTPLPDVDEVPVQPGQRRTHVARGSGSQGVDPVHGPGGGAVAHPAA